MELLDSSTSRTYVSEYVRVGESMRLTMLCLLLALAAANSFADQVIKEGNLQLTLPDGFSTPERSELPTGGVLIKSDVRKLFNLSVLVSKPSGLATLFTPRG